MPQAHPTASPDAFTAPVVLRGRHVLLEPLSALHSAEAREAVADGDIWRQWTTDIPAPDQVDAEIERRLAQQRAGAMLPFAVRDAAGGFAGMTSFMAIDTGNRRLEIGSTWYRSSVRRTALNTEAKLLLLTHSFEQLACIAVELRTHFFNFESRAAIARLGARQDGILRNHRIARNGTLRDTVVFSIVAGEWPTVQAHLRHQLDRPRP